MSPGTGEGTETPPRVRGRALSFSNRRESQQKHPRGCGEEDPAPRFKLQVMETPPRVRGRVPRLEILLYWQRNTPAGAGKRAGGVTHGLPRQKHPRGCGEERNFRWVTSPSEETPPRVRGRGISLQLRLSFQGNTPAGAGKRAGRRDPRLRSQKHPRGCGEE